MSLRFTSDWLKRNIASDPDIPQDAGPSIGSLGVGWLCPKCGRAHSPSVMTCPERANSAGITEGFNG